MGVAVDILVVVDLFIPFSDIMQLVECAHAHALLAPDGRTLENGAKFSLKAAV